MSIPQYSNSSDSVLGKTYRLGWALVTFVLILQIWSRFLPAPWAVLIADDWSNLARSLSFPSFGEAIQNAMTDAHRPLSMIAVNLGYQIFRDDHRIWTLISLVGNSLLLLFAMKMALELTGRRFVAAAAGVVLALLPNLTETFHWSTQVLNEVLCALVPYALSGWLWVAYVRRGGMWRLVVSLLAYGVGIFSYEVGVLLPGAYLLLLPWKRQPIKSVWRMAPFGAMFLFYMGWRATGAYGLFQTWQYPPHMQASVSAYGLALKSWHLLHWWVGEYMFGAMLNGFEYFSAIPLWPKRFLFVANAVVSALVIWGLCRMAKSENSANPKPFGNAQVVAFALAWVGAAWVVSLASYTCGRLNVLPAIGVSMLAALVLARLPARQWSLLLVVPIFLALLANQGTAEAHRQAGQINRAIYEHLQASQGEWADKKLIVMDTTGLRERQTAGLLRHSTFSDVTWAQCGNAPFARGFTFSAMVKMIAGTDQSQPQVLHDMEYGTRRADDQLLWHDRYNDTRPHTNALADVFWVDCLAVAQGR